VIFVSNDRSREEQVAFFERGGMHPDWLMVEWAPDLQDLMDTFHVEKIPELVVLDKEGKAVVKNACHEVIDLFTGKNKERTNPSIESIKAAVATKWTEWRRLAGDWRVSEGQALGGASSSGFVGAPMPGRRAGDQSEREALRAARLAALEQRAFGGDAGCGSSSSSFREPPLAKGFPESESVAAPAPIRLTPQSLSTIPGTSTASGHALLAGSGTFAAGAMGAPSGVAYTLSGGCMEVTAPQTTLAAEWDDVDIASDMASDGAESIRDVDNEVDFDKAVSNMVAMGFPEDAARQALEVSGGNMDEAISCLVDDM